MLISLLPSRPHAYSISISRNFPPSTVNAFVYEYTPFATSFYSGSQHISMHINFVRSSQFLSVLINILFIFITFCVNMNFIERALKWCMNGNVSNVRWYFYRCLKPFAHAQTNKKVWSQTTYGFWFALKHMIWKNERKKNANKLNSFIMQANQHIQRNRKKKQRE